MLGKELTWPEPVQICQLSDKSIVIQSIGVGVYACVLLSLYC